MPNHFGERTGTHSTWLCTLRRDQGQILSQPPAKGQHSPHEDLLTDAVLSARKNANDQHCAIHQQHKNDHAQKEKQSKTSDRFPLLTWVLGHFCVYHFFSGTFLFFPFNLLHSLSLFVRRKMGVLGADRWIWLLFLGGLGLADRIKSTNCNFNDYGICFTLIPISCSRRDSQCVTSCV